MYVSPFSRPRRSLLLIALAACLAHAQEPPQPIRGVAIVDGVPTPIVATDAGAAAAPPGASPILQKLLQLKLDRRPASILQAWSAPEPKPVEEPPAEPVRPVIALTPPPLPVLAARASVFAGGAASAAARRKELEDKKLQRDLEVFQRDVTLGRWDRVRAFVQALPEKDRVPAYEQLLRALVAPPQPPDGRLPPNLQENHAFTFADVLGVAGAAPDGLQKKQVELLAPVLRRALDCGHAPEELVAALRAETARPEKERVLTTRLATLLLAGVGLELELGGFLPDTEAAIAQNDREALNLLARHHLALHARDKKVVALEKAWAVTQAALAAGEIEEKEKAEALRRAVELAPRIRDELGKTWLEASFTSRPERGMEILATIGAQSARGFAQKGTDADFRRKGLELQKTAVDALLRTAPERAQGWRATLDLLAGNWIGEAAWSYTNAAATSLRPGLRRDVYGNYYYEGGPGDPRMAQQPQRIQAIEPGKLLEVRPEGVWASELETSLRPRYQAVVAQLYLKVNEETKAFPFIEALAGANAPKAKELAQEFLTVWTKNHDPNSERSRTNTYMFMYGFEQRASGIPLTRSKQERNLAELAVWLEKLRALPIGELDEQLVLNAFTTSHSTAEVFRLETIEKVFGPMDRLKPRTLAELAQRMRTNLATVWRRPDVQEQQKTKRKQKDIEREVLAGYEVAKAAVARALERHADHWALLVARAALQHDENNFRQEVQKSSEFAGRRQEALRALAAAADRYVAVAPGQPVEEETTQAFETWFYASLGACDLGAIDEQTQLAPGQTGPIRDALARLPGECGERHRAQFANTLFTRMSAVKPVAKHRYLKAGFEIVGDHPQAYEARKVFDYYKDLVTEIRLVAEVDGSAQVGTAPFGVRVSLRHTREIERESGGFGKYLQNQMNVRFAWNYGRPLENYRDKFQEAASQALAEHFEVRSITFNSEEVRSKADAEYGWRLTPYAYLLLSAKGPQVDRIPPLKLDLDFLDTSGYAVLPIESPAVPIDASKAPEGPRPHGGLEITQILDERRAAQGLLGLEIKATGRGLVPGLEELLDLAPPDFEVAKRNDQGLSVSRFADDHEGVISERLWTFQLRARPGLERPPSRFRFAVARVPDTKLVYQRYADADLVIAEPEVSLVESYGRRGFPWLWTALGAAALALGAGLFVGVRRARRRPHGPVGLQVPASITPFTVLGLLREIERHGALGEAGRGELRSAIAAIETHYFAETNGESPDLRQIAEHWVRRSA